MLGEAFGSDGENRDTESVYTQVPTSYTDGRSFFSLRGFTEPPPLTSPRSRVPLRGHDDYLRLSVLISHVSGPRRQGRGGSQGFLPPSPAVTCLEEVLGQLRAFAAARLAGDDEEGLLPHGLHQGPAGPADG